MELETLLLSVRIVAHVLTLLVLASYKDVSATPKWRYQLLAACFAGLSCALLMYSILFWHDQRNSPGLIPSTVLVCWFAFMVVKARGNVAKLLPRIKWTAHL